LKQAIKTDLSLDFEKSKAKFFPLIGKYDPPTQTDGFSCADWMSLSSIHVMSENTQPSEAKANFISLKQSMKEKVTEELVYCHRQLLAMLVFLCNSKVFASVDIKAEQRLRGDWERLCDSAKVPKAAAAAAPAAAAEVSDDDADGLETMAEFLVRLVARSNDKDESAYNEAYQRFVTENTGFGECWRPATEMNTYHCCGFR